MKSLITFLVAFGIIIPSFCQIKIINQKTINVAIQPQYLAVSPDGKMIVCGGNSRKLFIYDSQTGNERSLITIGEVFNIYDIKFSPDGRSFAAAGDNIFMIYDSKTLDLKYSYKCNSGSFSSISYSPDNKFIAAVFNTTARIWNLTTFEQEDLNINEVKYIKIEWSINPNLLALVDNNSVVTLWKLDEKKIVVKSPIQKSPISNISFDNTSEKLLICFASKSLGIYDLVNLDQINNLNLSGHNPWFVIAGQTKGSLLSGGEDGQLVYWEPPEYTPNIIPVNVERRILSADVCNNFKTIIVGLSNKTIQTLSLKFETNRKLKEIVTRKITQWQKQGKFEKSTSFINRVNDSTRLRQIEIFTQAAIDSLAQVNKNWKVESTNYDADNETFKINFKDFSSIYVHVPIAEAESFDKAINALEFSDPRFTVIDENFILIDLKIENPDNNLSYTYKKNDVKVFNSSKLELSLSNIELPEISNRNVDIQTTQEVSIPAQIIVSDVDKDLPSLNCKKNNAYVLIFGNEDYTKYNSNLSPEANVPFARNDAKSFLNYAQKILCIPAENIFYFTDAISSVMKREIEKVLKIINYQEDNYDLIFYFAGHGLPDQETKSAYILPVDISSENLTDGIKLSDLYAKLTNSKAKRTFVFLDACFSGDGRNQSLMAARAVKIKPLADSPYGNIAIISAVQADQRSLPYNQQKHGIFTFYLLKFLKETKGLGELGELSTYLKREVPVSAMKIFGIEQIPNVSVGVGSEMNWFKWKLRDE
jgi:hypothetical protein